MVCSKCGYAVPKGQNNCVYCGTRVVNEVVKPASSEGKRSGSAFAKQLRTSSDGPSENVSPSAKPEIRQSSANAADTPAVQKPSPFASSQTQSASPFVSKTASPFAQQTSGAPSVQKPIAAPFARRPMYAAFDPNSEDSPFVRKPLNDQPESETEKKQDQTVSKISEDKESAVQQASVQQPEAVAPEVEKADASAGEDAQKKKHHLSVAALTLVFVALAICFFINF